MTFIPPSDNLVSLLRPWLRCFTLIRTGARAVDLWRASVYQEVGANFEIKHKSRCLQKLELVKCRGQACQLGGEPPLSTGSDDDYLCLVESGKQRIKEIGRKFNRITWKQSKFYLFSFSCIFILLSRESDQCAI